MANTYNRFIPPVKMFVIVLLLAITINPCYAQTLFKKAKNLDNGINISGLEQTWNPDLLTLDPIKETDLLLLKQLGFKSIRLPIAFTWFLSKNVPDDDVFIRIDKVVKQCKRHEFKLIIDYHSGNLADSNYLTEIPKIVNVWQKLSKRYKKENANDLFFELYNEPPHMNPQIWRNAALTIAAAIRRIDPNRTLLIGATGYNGVDELSRFEPLPDNNIIYVYHFYEPFLFTHQGANWVGNASATTGVKFPYNAESFPTMDPKVKNTWGESNYQKYTVEGNEQFIKDRLLVTKNWSDKYHVPVICGEYGVYKKYTDLDSRCRYISAVRNALKTYNMPGILWEYNDNFSLFIGKPSLKNLPDCMKSALGYVPKK